MELGWGIHECQPFYLYAAFLALGMFYIPALHSRNNSTISSVVIFSFIRGISSSGDFPALIFSFIGSNL
jgi:hypothetical protein